MDDLPTDAHVYNILEPRSYALPRRTQPDPINSNFAHDLHLHETPSEIIRHWKMIGYTHILVYERGRLLDAETASDELTIIRQAALTETLTQLELDSQTPDKVYTIYQIP
jgi:hypothetical protein